VSKPSQTPIPAPPYAGQHVTARIRLAPFTLVAALGAAFTYVLLANPTDRKPDLLGGCSWYALFRSNGPFCGGTRMLWYLLHGNLIGAARSHLLALVGVPFAAYALAVWVAGTTFGVRLPRLRLNPAVYFAYGIAFVVFGAVLRNLHVFAWFHLDYMQPGIGP
jgi:hypothetical protein